MGRRLRPKSAICAPTAGDRRPRGRSSPPLVRDRLSAARPCRPNQLTAEPAGAVKDQAVRPERSEPRSGGLDRDPLAKLSGDGYDPLKDECCAPEGGGHDLAGAPRGGKRSERPQPGAPRRPKAAALMS